MHDYLQPQNLMEVELARNYLQNQIRDSQFQIPPIPSFFIKPQSRDYKLYQKSKFLKLK